VAKVTSKLQLTVPKAIADQYSIRPGDDLEWIPAGDSIRVIPSISRMKSGHSRTVEERLELFDQATMRQRAREVNPLPAEAPAEEAPKPHEAERGWRREDLYTRGRPR
jgi:bifunctional DNA-binding transcriptional regulator/antitoxin component of YhaV-PrlF toxin-antitoxin module